MILRFYSIGSGPSHQNLWNGKIFFLRSQDLIIFYCFFGDEFYKSFYDKTSFRYNKLVCLTLKNNYDFWKKGSPLHDRKSHSMLHFCELSPYSQTLKKKFSGAKRTSLFVKIVSDASKTFYGRERRCVVATKSSWKCWEFISCFCGFNCFNSLLFFSILLNFFFHWKW